MEPLSTPDRSFVKTHQRLYNSGGGGSGKSGAGGSFTDKENHDSPFMQSVNLPPIVPWRRLFGMTVAVLYILNQSHALPRPLAALVSRTLFWPTLPITFARRIGRWTTVVDDTVLIGGAPFGVFGIPDQLYEEGVRGVINMCAEYKGPSRKYRQLGMSELWLPTTDHFEPDLKDYEAAVDFIEQYRARGDRVYVHCRAGHGRSAATVMAWLVSRDPIVDMQSLNQELSTKRNVRKSLWKQPNLKAFHRKLLLEDATKLPLKSEEIHQDIE